MRGCILHGAFEPRQRADIDHAVIGAGGDRRAGGIRKGDRQQAFLPGPVSRASFQTFSSPVFADARADAAERGRDVGDACSEI